MTARQIMDIKLMFVHKLGFRVEHPHVALIRWARDSDTRHLSRQSGRIRHVATAVLHGNLHRNCLIILTLVIASSNQSKSR